MRIIVQQDTFEIILKGGHLAQRLRHGFDNHDPCWSAWVQVPAMLLIPARRQCIAGDGLSSG